MTSNRQWVLEARPLGRELLLSDFRLEAAPVPEIADGQVLIKTLYMSFDPAQKSWMENIASYMKPIEIGDAMVGTGAGRVIESRHPGFAPGDIVRGLIGWREFVAAEGASLEKIPPGTSMAASLSLLGSTGKTAYFGLLNVGKPKPGDTLVISGAAGATGSVVGQIGKIAGCRVIGIAGGPEKCAWLTEELGFDGAIDYKAEKVRRGLKALCPDGIDIFYDNVGGEILNDALARINVGARVVICGGISRYNADPRDPEQMPPGPRNYFNVVFTGATIQGFLLQHYEREYPIAEARLAAWAQAGKIKYKEDVLEGFERAPEALMRLFAGKNFGKQLLKVAEG